MSTRRYTKDRNLNTHGGWHLHFNLSSPAFIFNSQISLYRQTLSAHLISDNIYFIENSHFKSFSLCEEKNGLGGVMPLYLHNNIHHWSIWCQQLQNVIIRLQIGHLVYRWHRFRNENKSNALALALAPSFTFQETKNNYRLCRAREIIRRLSYF